MVKKGDNNKVARTIRFDKTHFEILEGLMPFYGGKLGEVVRNITMMWIHDNIGGETIKELKRMNAINQKNIKTKKKD